MAAEESSPPARTRLLVVDDYVEGARTMQNILTKMGYFVELAFDGETALATAERLRPDVVLLDLGMPGMDGYEVARRLRADARCEKCLIVAVTGFGREGDRRRSKEAGVDHHLIKPLDYVEVKRLIG